jgi:hypothetical protein
VPSINFFRLLLLLLFLTLDVPLIWYDSEVSAHFFHFRWSLDCVNRLEVYFRLLRALSHADVCGYNQVFLAIDLIRAINLLGRKLFSLFLQVIFCLF